MTIQGLSAKTLAAQARAKANAAYAEWAESQGAKIKAARPLPVFYACSMMAVDLSHTRDPLLLKAEEIAICESRAVSSARAERHGLPPRSVEEWRAQCEAIREGWKAPHVAGEAA